MPKWVPLSRSPSPPGTHPLQCFHSEWNLIYGSLLPTLVVVVVVVCAHTGILTLCKAGTCRRGSLKRSIILGNAERTNHQPVVRTYHVSGRKENESFVCSNDTEGFSFVCPPPHGVSSGSRGRTLGGTWCCCKH